jgi:hypothetical protein
MRQEFKKVTRVTPAQDPPGHYSTANSLLGPRGDPDPSGEFREFRNHRDLPPGPQPLLSHPMMASRMTAFHLIFVFQRKQHKNPAGKPLSFQSTGLQEIFSWMPIEHLV